MKYWPRQRARQVPKSEYGAAALQAHPIMGYLNRAQLSQIGGS